MKKTLGLFFVLIIGIILSACSNETIEIVDAAKFVKEYKEKQYNINPSKPPIETEIGDRVKKYLAKDAFEELEVNGTLQIAPNFAKKTNSTINLDNLSIGEGNKNEDGTIDYQYTLMLRVSDEKSSEVFEKKGQLSISNDRDGLKITRDWEEDTKIEDVPI